MLQKTFTFWRRLVGSSAAPATESGSAVAVDEDRRLWMRYATDLQGKMQTAEKSDSAKTLVRVRDISLGGANVVADAPIQPGQMVTLELPASDNVVSTVLACVVRASRTEDGKWSLGCVFSRELTNEDLGRFGAQKAQAGSSDQRTWVRFSTNLKAQYRKVGDPDAPAFSAGVLNISANGIGLSVHPSLQAGTLLNVDLFDKEGHLVRTILACVVHTTQRAGGDFAVGCNFIRELSEEELASLM